MESIDDLYCKLYVDTDMTRQELVESIAQVLEGAIERNTVAVGQCEIDVRLNTEYDDEQKKNPDNGFLFFRYFLDVNALEGQKRADQITLVSKLLEHFWSLGFLAVAASDYEDELPRNGYNSRSASGT